MRRGKTLASVAVRVAAALVSCVMATAVLAADPPKPAPDLSGQRRIGIASFYADNFGGKPMANGAPMDLNGNNAASRTLPLGTKAKVTNLETGKSATVVIADRGPYVQGRIVDLSPATARKIGITRRKGISPVSVAPITVPQPDGTTKEGAAAHPSKPLREASAAPEQTAKNTVKR
jgi:rare lipoprotein A